MQTLNRLLQVTQAASALTDLARHKKTFLLPVMDTAETFYLHADNAAVRIVRWNKPQVEVSIETRPPVAWRTATDYDANGVYVVVMRRVPLGNIANAVLSVLVPTHVHLSLRLNDGLVSMDHIRGTLHIPPTENLPPLLPPEA